MPIAAVLRAIGLTVSDAFRPMMVRIAAERRLPFNPLIPNDETVEAMKAAQRGELAAVGGVDGLKVDLADVDGKPPVRPAGPALAPLS